MPPDGVPTVDEPAPRVPTAARTGIAARDLIGWANRCRAGIAAIVAYCLLGTLMYGVGTTVSGRAVPVCACGDIAQGVWFLAWPAYALRHGLNPLFSGWVNYPHGMNLMDATSSPALGILGAPITWLAGPVVTTNLLYRLAFALSASAMYLTLRRFTRWRPAAFAGGLLYGFSPYMVGQGYGHLFILFVPLPPLFVLLGHELWERRRWPAAVTGLVLGVAGAVQLLISQEVLAACAVLAIPAILALAWHHRRDGAAAWRRLGTGLGVAAVTFGVLAAYPLWFYYAGPAHIVGTQHGTPLYASYHQDLLGVVVPSFVQWLDPGFLRTTGARVTRVNYVEDQPYLGVVVVLVAAAVAVICRRVGIVVVAALIGAWALVLSLGRTLYVDGHDTGIPLPYRFFVRREVLGSLLDTRFSLYVAGAAAILLAVGLDRLRGTAANPRIRRTIAATTLGVLALVPLAPANGFSSSKDSAPRFFTTASDLTRVPAGSVLLTYPVTLVPPHGPGVWDVSPMLWQAMSGMRYRAIGVYGPVPGPTGAVAGPAAREPRPVALPNLLLWAYNTSSSRLPEPRDTATERSAIRAFLLRYRVDTVVLDPRGGIHPGVVASIVSRALGQAPGQAGGLEVWYGVLARLGAAHT
jgi:hypothetical protein